MLEPPDEVEAQRTAEANAKMNRLGSAEQGADSAAAVFYLGFDRFTYPGDAVMSNWWSTTPLYWAGFYLAPAPHHSDASWMTKRSTIRAMGWGCAPLYVGRQVGDSNLTAAQGTLDAHNAATLASNAGFPSQSFIFLDVETGGTLSTAFVNYIVAWASEVAIATNYHPGVYCSYNSGAQLNSAFGGLIVRFWCWRLGCPPSPGCHLAVPAPGPTGCGFGLAQLWQYAQSGQPDSCTGFSNTGHCNLTSGGSVYSVDLDTAISSDPST